MSIEESFITEIIAETQLKCSEEIDKFVFTIIQDWIYREQTILIPKQLIIIALQTFKAEHPEQFEFLLNINEDKE